MEWIEYAEQQPEAAGAYEWRVPSKVCENMNVRVIAHHRERGAGYKTVLSPAFDHWTGAELVVPKNTYWRETEEGKDLKKYEQEIVCVDGLEFAPCPFCGMVPKLRGMCRSSRGGFFANPGPHELNYWWLECCAWARTPRCEDPRILESTRRELLSTHLMNKVGA